MSLPILLGLQLGHMKISDSKFLVFYGFQLGFWFTKTYENNSLYAFPFLPLIFFFSKRNSKNLIENFLVARKHKQHRTVVDTAAISLSEYSELFAEQFNKFL